MRRLRRLPPLALAALLAGCVGSALAPVLISDEREREMGQRVVTNLEQSDGFHRLDDAEVNAYVNGIGQRIAAASPVQRSFPFSFQVVRRDEVNAFALPGGFCYVQTGLITEAQCEAQLVGVIAHEMAHVALGHHREEIANQALLQTAQGMVFNEGSPFAAVAAARIASGLGMLTFNRGQESEADRLGAVAMARAGWDPRGLRDFFARLDEISQGGGGGRIAQMLSTHPSNTARVQQLDALIASMNPPPNLTMDSPRFGEIKRRVAGIRN